MKKVILINSVNFGSTGNIMLQIAERAALKGYNAYPSCANSRSNKIKNVNNQLFIGTRLSHVFHVYMSWLTGLHGLFSFFSTICYLRKISRIQPDLIHLHNLHGDYINLPLLFKFIKRRNIPIVWTLHDCWSFTGQCPHFTMVKCDKWKSGCYECPQINLYPASIIDCTRKMWKLKKKWFTGVEDLTIVTPSQWLADLVKLSYLKEYPVKVINNGIDLDVFKPTESDFREKNRLENRFVLLGVAFGWGKRKGLDVFIELSKRLDDRFQIVLVGTNEEIDRQLTNKIISIHRTNNQRELAEIYTAADLFINPTREENYPTVNMESIACGTPVLTFKTGGSPEIPDSKTGAVVEVDDIDELERQIIRICNEHTFSKDDCLVRAKSFDKDIKYQEYIDLY